LSLSYPLVWLLAVAVVAFLSTFGFLLWNYYTQAVDTSVATGLHAENLLLREKLAGYEEKIDQLTSQMTRWVELDASLRVLANLEPIDDDVRRLGVGGNLPTEPELRDLDPPVAEEVESFSSRLDQLARQTELQTGSFEQIKSHLEKAADLRDHTPSIRPCAGWLASGFGYRRDPFTRGRKFHDGLDITAPVGTPVSATADGTVESIKYYRNGYGLTLVVNHGYGYKTVYAHLSLSKVKRYQKVKRGDVIALVGNSGRSTGPHLHYEVQVTGKSRNPLNYIIPDDKNFH
jgi:murein DD-endopeptidase MepM/ murein hydrolase activator NlpD